MTDRSASKGPTRPVELEQPSSPPPGASAMFDSGLRAAGIGDVKPIEGRCFSKDSKPREQKQQVFSEIVQQLTDCYQRDMKHMEGQGHRLRLENETLRQRIRLLADEEPEPLDEMEQQESSPLPEMYSTPSPKGNGTNKNTMRLAIPAMPGAIDEDTTMTARSSRGGDEGKSGHDDEAQEFPLRDAWQKARAANMNRKPTVSNMLKIDSFKNEHHDEQDVMEDEKTLNNEYEGIMKPLISYPSSKYRVVWELFGGLLIMWDMVTIPMQVFAYPDSTFTLSVEWLTLIFWSVNVYATLTVGYLKDGSIITQPTQILRNYLRTWFAVDCATLVPDWLFTILGAVGATGGGGADSVRMLRMLRLARTIRLLRLLKLKWILDSINDYLDSEYASIFTSILKMVLILLMINHVAACAWYAVGAASCIDYNDNCWLEEYGLRNEDWGKQYVTSFHWSITQFTPASMQVQPQNLTERVFAVFVVIFALVGFSYVVGSITGSLAQLRSMSEAASKEFWMLRRFLKRNHVQLQLAVRIQKFVEHAYLRQQEKMNVGQVKILNLLSSQLNDELQCAMNLPHLQVHPLFMYLHEMSPISTQRVAKEAVGRNSLARGDTQFLPDQDATCMFFVASGRLLYRRSHPDDDSVRIEYVDAGEDWITEPILWTPKWVHVGELKAVTEAELVSVNPGKFADILVQYQHVAYMVARYGRKFMAWVESIRSDTGLLSDVIQGDQVSDEIKLMIPKTEDQTLATSPR